ncbi:D-alanine--D-alanine ligase [Verrucomicrobium sp. BvORR106]|uniref:D-alanine--D-alanine ligase family protein n=1 Tax=Verrucomicrobium sp. BvORR106 TaxID=1403819 RepID=UPI00056FEDF7|nr:D-alanine--D-alanine ligase [Verrucomicrobium sp. BvORR106]
MALANHKIAVLKGGPGSERAVSLKSAESVVEALKSLGAEVVEIDITSTDFTVPGDVVVAVNMIHGTFGEDGQLQTLLEKQGVAYTGAGVETSRVAFDKNLSKDKFVAGGVPTPQSQVLKLDGVDQLRLSLPVVVKPPREGSSVGVHIVHTEEELVAALADAKQYGADTLVEEFVDGKELTVGVIGGEALPIIHIEPVSGFYDINNKYPWMSGTGKTNYHCPADLDIETTQRVQEAALAAMKAVGVEVYGRVDVMLRKDGQPFVLEINTIPGMTVSSLLPKAARVAGLEFPQLMERIIELSLEVRRAG